REPQGAVREAGSRSERAGLSDLTRRPAARETLLAHEIRSFPGIPPIIRPGHPAGRLPALYRPCSSFASPPSPPTTSTRVNPGRRTRTRPAAPRTPGPRGLARIVGRLIDRDEASRRDPVRAAPGK